MKTLFLIAVLAVIAIFVFKSDDQSFMDAARETGDKAHSLVEGSTTAIVKEIDKIKTPKTLPNKPNVEAGISKATIESDGIIRKLLQQAKERKKPENPNSPLQELKKNQIFKTDTNMQPVQKPLIGKTATSSNNSGWKMESWTEPAGKKPVISRETLTTKSSGISSETDDFTGRTAILYENAFRNLEDIK